MTDLALDGPAPASVAFPSKRFAALALAGLGVVFGDIGTSPLYAFKETVAHLKAPGGVFVPADVLGVVSLMLWALTLIVTFKYVLIVMRFDNRGEGGILSLMALVQRSGGRGAKLVLLVGMLGAGLFFGDAVLTPAVSVLSAVEGLTVVHGLHGQLDRFVVPIALALLIGLFVVQRHGSGGVGRWFGPVCIVWFVALALLGLAQVAAAPVILKAVNPAYAAGVLVAHPGVAAAILGSVFLTVTGAEALYADMGHFGRAPIAADWMILVFPCLMLNYLGQGALVLQHPAAAANPFFLLAPEGLQLPLVLLAAAATVIASQAVISGAFSITQQAIQLDLLPRMRLLQTSHHEVGQVYAPQVNWILMIAVAALVLAFRSSSALADAYGISVVGAMITSSVLAVVAIHRLKRRPIWQAALLFSPLLLVEGVFLLANLAKVAHGGWIPLSIAGALILLIWSWVRGVRAVRRAEQSNVTVQDVIRMAADRPPMRARGTAVFLTADPNTAPAALLHNLKHNGVLHEQVVLLTVRFTRGPHVSEADRVTLTPLASGWLSLVLTYGFMDRPDVSRGMALARRTGLKFDIMRTSFFVSRRTLVPGQAKGFAALQNLIFLFMTRNALRAADFFAIPPSRVVELGAQQTF